MAIVASIFFDEGRLAEAEKLYREALDIRRRILGPDHPSTLALMDGFATTLATEHRHAEAEKLLRETLDIRRRVLGPEHRDTLMSINNLANMVFLEGRYDEAEKLQRETLDIQMRVLGPDHPDTAMSTYNLGGIALHKGKRDEAVSLLRNAVDHGLAPKLLCIWKRIPISNHFTATRASPPWWPTPKNVLPPLKEETSQPRSKPDPANVTGLATSGWRKSFR